MYLFGNWLVVPKEERDEQTNKQKTTQDKITKQKME